MLNREDLEEREARSMGRLAVFSRASRGRRAQEAEDPLRTCFQRDRDRILHSAAFRRLQQKTQVLPATLGDHFRTRLTHSLEVSQLARSACLTLGLNTELAETVALAHDLGHPPFGHAGETALHEFMKGHGGFRHNAQGIRIVDSLEDRSPFGFGLNLCYETRVCLLKSTVPEGFPLSTDLPRVAKPYLEGQLVDLCDRAAYVSHDMEDAIRTGLLPWEEFGRLELPREARAHAEESLAELSGGKIAHTLGERQIVKHTVSALLSLLVHDLVLNTDAAMIANRKLSSAQDVVRAKGYLATHSRERRAQMQDLAKLLHERFYEHPDVIKEINEATQKMSRLFEFILSKPQTMPDHFRERIDAEGLERTVCDYVSGMTDRFVGTLVAKVPGAGEAVGAYHSSSS